MYQPMQVFLGVFGATSYLHASDSNGTVVCKHLSIRRKLCALRVQPDDGA